MENDDQPIRDKIHDNPADFKCCHCGIQMQKRMSTTGDGTLRKGLILICSQCARPNIVGDSGLKPLSKEEFFALDKPTQRAILLSAQGIKQLVESGGQLEPVWKPIITVWSLLERISK